MKAKKHLFLIALGMGDENFLTAQAKNALREAQIIFGGERILEIARKILLEEGNPSENAEAPSKKIPFEPIYRAEEIFAYLSGHLDFSCAAVVFSGDTGFFSGAAAFCERFRVKPGMTETLNSGMTEAGADWEISLLPGIASPLYFASKLHKSWQKWKMFSLHGAKCNTIEQIRKNPACFFILSGIEDVRMVGKKIEKALKNGVISSVKCYLGSNLSYNVEKIIQIQPKEMSDFQEINETADRSGAKSPQSSLFVLLVENENALNESESPNLKDEDFIRAEKIPMTKKEVRQLSIADLGLSKSSVVYDIGSGTGSITVEAARIAVEGQVIAVDSNSDALALTQKNAEKFCLENVTFLQGSAPDCLKNAELPPPSHVFIGGSRGNLAEIIQFALKKNPSVRIVANFVSLENLTEMQNCLKNLEEGSFIEADCGKIHIENLEIKQISVSRAEKAGNFHLMKAMNPVWIVSFSGKIEKKENQGHENEA
ncbi:precorrin-6Y C5,15-methyltransferase (decarboxylating) subunit CbiT [Treponema sp. UBA3813]|uniref:precorrin-6Y C5,15-methyltransferase (decarboxylating) subunit CbiT n=1 Tax=Treponema sp. UBA3813 TaxID=1947715 RepID=UPI0025FCBD38|nr:precorrin-6Y C5,15-methyltransferase (decarboxylating) subunit CbiT [Treponema sp. UBA3813]